MVSGLWSNSNYDDNKNTRKRALDDIEYSYQEILLQIYGKIKEQRIEDNPFFAAIDLDDNKAANSPLPHDTQPIEANIDQQTG